MANNDLDIDTVINHLYEILSVTPIDKTSFDVWKGNFINILSKFYANDSNQIKSLHAVKFSFILSQRIYGVNSFTDFSDSPRRPSKNNLDSCITNITGQITGIIKDLKTYGFPMKKESNHSNSDKIILNVSQNNSQEVNIKMELILSLIRDELKGKQYDELMKLINSKEPAEKKKSQILSKLLSFGENVASNILATILTNQIGF